MSTTPIDQEKLDKTELENLRILRATLESVKQIVDGVGTDVKSAAHNYENVTELSQRWASIISETKEALEKMKKKQAGGVGGGGGKGSVPEEATENAEVSLI